MKKVLRMAFSIVIVALIIGISGGNRSFAQSAAIVTVNVSGNSVSAYWVCPYLHNEAYASLVDTDPSLTVGESIIATVYTGSTDSCSFTGLIPGHTYYVSVQLYYVSTAAWLTKGIIGTIEYVGSGSSQTFTIASSGGGGTGTGGSTPTLPSGR